MKGCNAEGCEAKHHSHGWCGKHWARVKAHGNPDTVLPKLGRHRAAMLTYDGAHKRVKYDRGPASDHQCVDCGLPARDWSYDGGSPNEVRGRVFAGQIMAYSLDPADYSPRCRSCHRIKDGAGNRPRDAAGRFL